MIYEYDVALIGGDLRQTYLASLLEEYGYTIITFGLNRNIQGCNLNYTHSSEHAISSSKTIILPIPFSRDKKNITGFNDDISVNSQNLSIEDFLTYLQSNHYIFGGNIPEKVIQICQKKNISYFDFMKNDEIALLNAIATAEGAIAESICKSNINLHQSRALILGYGKCGKVLASKLHSLGAKVTIGARRKGSLVEAYTNGFEGVELDKLEFTIKDFDYIFNTIPDIIITNKLLLYLSSETTIIDIASSPGGVDYEAAKILNRNAYSCLGIPGKISPKSSAKILAEAIIPILKERGE